MCGRVCARGGALAYKSTRNKGLHEPVPLLVEHTLDSKREGLHDLRLYL